MAKMIGYVCGNLGCPSDDMCVVGDIPAPVEGQYPKTAFGHRPDDDTVDENDDYMTCGPYVPLWKIEFNAPDGFRFPSTENLLDRRFPHNKFPHVYAENVDINGVYDNLSGVLVIAATEHNKYAKVSFRKLSFIRSDGSEEILSSGKNKSVDKKKEYVR